MAVKVIVKKPAKPKGVSIVLPGGKRVSLGRVPPEITYSEIPEFGSLYRQGAKPGTRISSLGLRRLSFVQIVASADWRKSVESTIRRFTDIARKGTVIRLSGGSAAFEQPCRWVVKGLEVNVTRRATNNAPSRAELSWELEEYVDVTSKLIRPKPKKGKGKTSKGKPIRTHTVRAGESLWSIAQKYFGASQGHRWPEIHRLNSKILPNPNVIRAGMRLRIPG